MQMDLKRLKNCTSGSGINEEVNFKQERSRKVIHESSLPNSSRRLSKETPRYFPNLPFIKEFVGILIIVVPLSAQIPAGKVKHD